jgi:hypothetical protein
MGHQREHDDDAIETIRVRARTRVGRWPRSSTRSAAKITSMTPVMIVHAAITLGNASA